MIIRFRVEMPGQIWSLIHVLRPVKHPAAVAFSRANSGSIRSKCLWWYLAAALAWSLSPFSALAQDGVSGYEAVAAQAAAARDQHDLPRAIELYGQVTQLNAQWPDGWWYLGSLAYQADQYATAINALTHYIDLTPTAGAAMALRGLCEFETGQYQQALDDIEHGIEHGAASEPRKEAVLRLREAELLTRLGRFDEALHTFTLLAKAGQLDTETPLAAGLAGLHFPLLPSGTQATQQELRVAAGDATLRFLAGDQPGARQAFGALFERFPGTAGTHYLYGYLLFATDPVQSVEELKRELELFPANASASALVAWVLLMEDNPADALPYAEKAAVAQPALPVAQLVLGRSRAETGDLPGGIEHLERALQLDPVNFEAHIALVAAYSRAGRKADAQRERLLCLQMSAQQAKQLARP
jgi:tetratricopeptide (TPR) repeat protein